MPHFICITRQSFVAVGYGAAKKINETQLHELAGDNVYLTKNAKSLTKSKHIKNIVKEVCGKFKFA